MSVDPILSEEIALSSGWRLQRTGNFVAAFDLAQDALRRWPGSRALTYLSILALASCGSADAALEALRAAPLDTNTEDALALEARLLKDLAFGGPERDEAMLARAAHAYEGIAERTEGTYSRQNAALLWMLAGDTRRATRLAEQVTARIAASSVPREEEDAYFHWATLAEAALTLGDRALLRQAVAAANPLCRRNAWARSRTYLQMQRLSELRSDCAGLVDEWYRPPVGLVLSPEYVPADRTGMVPIESHDVPALAYCTGGDSDKGDAAVAAQGIPLHVIYPHVARGEASSPDASGHRGSATWSSLLLDEGGDHARICAAAALGLSLGHADALRARWMALSRLDGRWHAHGAVDPESLRAAIEPQEGRGGVHSSRYGFLFADAVRYSTLSAANTRRYWTELLPKTAAAVLKQQGDQVILRKTWGDAIHAVFRTASAAASAALDMQAATARLAEELEPGRRLSFRIAVHFGAADRGIDPVEDSPSIFGPQLSFAARIVPVAPPAGIFATEPFAAQLRLEGVRNIHCHYVGTTSLAKSYGRVRLLRLG